MGILRPGEAPGRYPAESDQEGSDHFHGPPGTAHVTVGAGTSRCAIFMLGARTPGG